MMQLRDCKARMVAPPAGAWIETQITLSYKHITKRSRLPQARGLKRWLGMRDLLCRLSRLPQARGLKQLRCQR